jgi:hypothetical protein
VGLGDLLRIWLLWGLLFKCYGFRHSLFLHPLPDGAVIILLFIWEHVLHLGLSKKRWAQGWCWKVKNKIEFQLLF